MDSKKQYGGYSNKFFRKEILNANAECVVYNFDSEFSMGKIKEVYERYNKTFGNVDLYKMTKEELLDLGFTQSGVQGKESLKIPLWVKPVLPEYILVTYGTEDKFKIVDTNKIDNDNRDGLTAYGIDVSKCVQIDREHSLTAEDRSTAHTQHTML